MRVTIFASFVGDIGVNPLVHGDQCADHFTARHGAEGGREVGPILRGKEGGQELALTLRIFGRPLQSAAIQQETEGITHLDGDLRPQRVEQVILLAWVKAMGDHVVEKIMAPVDGAGGIRREVQGDNPGLQGVARKEPHHMGRKTDLALVAVFGPVIYDEFHAVRFIRTFTFISCPPQPLNVPRNGVASEKSRPKETATWRSPHHWSLVGSRATQSIPGTRTSTHA